MLFGGRQFARRLETCFRTEGGIIDGSKRKMLGPKH